MQEVIERRLWLGVILRATQEAESSYIYGGDEEAIKNAARRWLMVRSPDLLEVCRMAGLDDEHTERLIKESQRKYGKRRNTESSYSVVGHLSARQET